MAAKQKTPRAYKGEREVLNKSKTKANNRKVTQPLPWFNQNPLPHGYVWRKRGKGMVPKLATPHGFEVRALEMLRFGHFSTQTKPPKWFWGAFDRLREYGFNFRIKLITPPTGAPYIRIWSLDCIVHEEVVR
ncbi:MAG: hypothetical protein WAZ18_03620 [Alphaproteobacteria bacterium]